jgi:hypothetical protein
VGRGYRFYTGESVAWPFGYGGSYTTVAYAALFADAKEAGVGVTNTGKVRKTPSLPRSWANFSSF